MKFGNEIFAGTPRNKYLAMQKDQQLLLDNKCVEWLLHIK